MVSFRARDAAGNSSGTRTLPVWIDKTAPATALDVQGASGGSDTAILTFAATDELSGLARTVVRVDGGDWIVVGPDPVTIRGVGAHVVDYASTDVAGIAEVMRHATVTLVGEEAIEAVLPPQVSGAARYGSTLTSTVGTWNTEGLSFSREWLRDGAPIAGATGASYELGVADIGHRIAVRVTATKPGKASGTSTSVATSLVAKTASSVEASVNKTKVEAGKKIKVELSVSTQGPRDGRGYGHRGRRGARLGDAHQVQGLGGSRGHGSRPSPGGRPLPRLSHGRGSEFVADDRRSHLSETGPARLSWVPMGTRPA